MVSFKCINLMVNLTCISTSYCQWSTLHVCTCTCIGTSMVNLTCMYMYMYWYLNGQPYMYVHVHVLVPQWSTLHVYTCTCIGTSDCRCLISFTMTCNFEDVVAWTYWSEF